jgi:Spy/CpxP family protein refolding chaperone
MKRSLTTWIYVGLVFLSGSAVGAFAHRLFYTMTVSSSPAPAQPAAARPSPEEFRRRYVEEIRNRCQLTPEQVTKLEAILDATRKRHKEMQERAKPEMKAIQEEQVNQIRAMLNESQRSEYEKFREERDKRRQQRAGSSAP